MKQILLLFACTILGCVPAYHDYPCGCVPYGYCAPASLPPIEFCDSGCPSPIAAEYQGSAAPPLHLPLPPARP